MPVHSPFFLSPRPAVLAASLLFALAGTGAAHALSAPGAAVGPVLRYHQFTQGAQHQADIAVGADGNAVAVWYTDRPVGSIGVRARRLDGAGNPVGNEITVNSGPLAGSYFYPSVAADARAQHAVRPGDQGQATGRHHADHFRHGADAAGAQAPACSGGMGAAG